MATDAFQQFLTATEEGDIRDNRARIAPERTGPLAPTNLTETFSRGLQAGAQGLRTDVEYFKALGNTLTGDDRAAAKAIEQARYSEELSAPTMAGMETFEEFLDQPTFSGFLTQAASAAGQVAPSIFTTIAGAGVGGITAAAGRGALSVAGRATTKRILTDSLERTAKGVASPEESYLAGEMYKYFRRGAVTGAFASEYVPLSGSNLSEALESGKPLDVEQAQRAALVGIPQAAIGVGGEIALLKLVGNVATRRATGAGGGVFQQLANDIGRATFKGGAIEGTTEVVQEGISVANRFDLDEDFTEEEAKLRLAQAAFAGAIGGKAAGAAGGTLGSVFRQAREQLNKSQEQRVDQKINDQQFGETDSGVTTSEPNIDLDAQIAAIHDPNSTKQATWIAGEQGRERFPEDGRYEKDGKVFYTRYIPGRGTIITKDEKLADEVVKAGASEESLATALGYTGAKPEGADLVVQALDPQGNVVSEELTTAANLEAAQENARQLSPIFQHRTISLDQALERRKQKLFREEAKRAGQTEFDFGDSEPTVNESELRSMEFDDETLEELGMVDQSAFENMDEDQRQRFEDQQQFQENRSVTEGEVEVVAEYPPRDTFKTPFPNEVELQEQYTEQFGDDSNLDRYSGSTMKKALREQADNPNSVVSIQEKDGAFQVIREDFGEMYVFQADGRQQRLPKDQYLVKAVGYAQGGEQKNRNAVLVRPDGRRTTIDLNRLMSMGRGLLRTREGTEYVGGGGRINTDRAALAEILAELVLYQDNSVFNASLADLLGDEVSTATGRFDIQDKNGVSLLRQRNFAPDGTFKGQNLQVRDGLGINYLLARGPRGSEAKASTIEEEVEREVNDDDALPTDFGRRRTEVISRDFDPKEDIEPTDPEFAEANLEAEDGLSAAEIEARARSVSSVIANTDEGQTTQVFAEEREQVQPDGENDLPIDRRRGGAPSTSGKVTPAAPPRQTRSRYRGGRAARPWRTDEVVKGVHDELLNNFSLEERPSIFSYAELEQLTDTEIRNTYEPSVASTVLRLKGMLEARPTAYGFYDRSTNTIIIKETGNSTFDALTLAHEMGHAIYRQEQTAAMANPALRKRLEEAYRKSSIAEVYEKQADGFEEWYADQVAKWATKRYLNKQARNMTERHFKKLGRRLYEMFTQLTRGKQKRFGERNFITPDVTFEQYIEGTLDTAANHTANANTQTVQLSLIPDIVEQTKEIPEARATARAYEKVTKSSIADAIRTVLLPADNILRRVAGDEIADMFYVRAQDLVARGKLGFLRATNTTIGRWKNRFERDIGDMSSPEVQAGFEEAFSGKATAELSGVARQIRKYLEAFYDEYIEPSNTGIGKRPDFFPVSLNLLEITERREEFKQLLLDNDSTLDTPKKRAAAAKKIDKAIDRLVNLGQSIEEETAIDPTNPEAAVEQAIKLTANIDRALLGDFVNSPDAAFIDYMRHVIKRVEFNRATGGPEALQARLAQLSDEDRKTAEDVISSYLGYQKAPLAPWMRKLNSWGQFIQFVTILPFATIASLPDLAGPVINHKDFSGLWTGFKQIVATVKNRQEAQQLARDIGVVTSETVANAWVTQAEQDYMDPMVRKLSDGFFRLIGLDFFTKFSREFASNMGVQFLLNHARNEFNNPNSTRYLEELGVTAEDVLAWNKNRSFDTAEGAKVRDALARFVESSIMRPNAAERPVWASDPRFALVWQLKGYFYSYYKTIMGGVLREAKARTNTTKGAAQLTAVSAILLLTAVATMPLAMMGMELREHAKNGLAWLLPGVSADQKYFRSDKMDWDDYWFDIIEKSGFLGPLSMARMGHQNAEWGDSAIFSLLGPTAETIEEAFKNGWRVDRTFGNRLAPIYSQL